jgi:hypothetical protein
MGWLDKVKATLGIVDSDEVEEEEDAPRAERRKRGDRPPLDGISAAPQETLDDVLAARDRGDKVEARRLLERIDRGHGLRLVLRAAAALEAKDEAALTPLLPRVAAEEPMWKLQLMVAAALRSARAGAFRERAEAGGAPGWALAWADAMSTDPATSRRGMVELLFIDAPLARTVAARDLALEGAEADPAGAERYVSFAHGRDCIARFGAEIVADLMERAG